MRASNERLTILSEAEQAALYELPNFDDDRRFGDVRQEAFTTVISMEKLQEHVSNLDDSTLSEIDFYWKTMDQEFHRYKLHLRSLLMTLDFSSVIAGSPWLFAINWLKKTFNAEKQLHQWPIEDCPEKTLPKRLKTFLINTNPKGKQRLNADRYEFWIYRQLVEDE